MVSSAKDWNEARSHCQGTNGGDLASIPDMETNEVVLSLISDSGMYWIGGTDAASEGVWQWADGTPWSFTNWVSGQPNNGNHGSQHHLVIRGMAHEMHGQWLDVTETVNNYFICQY